MTDYTALSPQEKLAILKEMGFQEQAPPEHTATCPAALGPGFICTCHPPVTTFLAPADVRYLLGEDDTTRREFKAKRDACEDDYEAPSPGPWIYYSEKIRKERSK